MKTALLILLCTIATPVVAHAFDCFDVPGDPCDLPGEFTHTVSVDEAGVRITFAARQPAFVQGDIIEFRLRFENVGTEYFCTNLGYQPIDAVFVLPDPCASPADCVSAWPWSYPQTVYFAPGFGVGLDPGECRVFSYAWDTSTHPADAGDYDVIAGLFEATFDDTFGSFLVPSNGMALPIQIMEAVPNRSRSLSTMKAIYR